MSIILLFFGFFLNLWKVADQKWFDTHQKDTESHVMGRMVKSRQDGIFSAGGLNGWGTAKKADQEWIPTAARGPQYNAYLYNYSFENFKTYNSQPGGQGMIFSLLDKLIPVSSIAKFWFFYILTSLLTAITLTLIIVWFYSEFGGLAGTFVLASAVLSHWLTVFGKNLWWSTWGFYLPMIAVLYFLKSYKDSTNRHFIWFSVLIFISVSIKCFINGYEYITTTLVMMVVPFVYYGIIDNWNKKQWLKYSIGTGIGCGVAIFLSLMMLCIQIGSVKGGFMDGIDHVFYSIGKRTHGEAEDFPPIYGASLKAGTFGVVKTYINGVYFDFNNYFKMNESFITKHLFKIRYSYLIVMFIFMSVVAIIRTKQRTETSRQRSIALIIATWFSFLAPLSWFVIFKSHSFIHTHMSYLLWQMPFTLFGFAVVGYGIYLLLSKPDTETSKLETV
ncbi:hypothetical protein JT359_07770 [Candidatus Poribacteria bacterium]|nr:hypothetical protein [Candidatus Poribacteria bacterium]